MNFRIFAAAAFSLGVLAGLSPAVQAAQPGEPDCLQPIDPYGFKVVDDRTVIVTDQRRHDFKLSLQPGCVGLSYSFGIGLKSFSTSRLECLQRGDSVVVPPGGGMPRQDCRITSIQAYTPEMQHADAMAKAAAKQH